VLPDQEVLLQRQELSELLQMWELLQLPQMQWLLQIQDVLQEEEFHGQLQEMRTELPPKH
jgi:hypothetical protein